MIGGTGGFHGGVRDYHNLYFKVGDPAKPGTDLEAVCDRVMKAVLLLRKLEKLADAVEY